ncbi:hypothetical protein [Pseudoalteromonas spongiae]|uniref:hypothetical protein n=1 Tax=Pseudoalteromonas spongiae TaxID=298657 RepID=UPI00110B062F|nr:hypothetical protein [Pseudoalteromonas spongiae]TMO83635.1 hypothetical protein CWC15_14350 [Pseudoalteromonas spongiae]
MNKLLFGLFLVIFVVDLAFRVIPSIDKNKEIDFTPEAIAEFNMTSPEKPNFNKHLFGKVKESEVPKKAEKVVEREPELQLLAIYSTPETYAFVRASNRNWPSKKVKVGELFAGYRFVEVTQFGAIFEKAGTSQEFKVFKR